MRLSKQMRNQQRTNKLQALSLHSLLIKLTRNGDIDSQSFDDI